MVCLLCNYVLFEESLKNWRFPYDLAFSAPQMIAMRCPQSRYSLHESNVTFEERLGVNIVPIFFQEKCIRREVNPWWLKMFLNISSSRSVPKELWRERSTCIWNNAKSVRDVIVSKEIAFPCGQCKVGYREQSRLGSRLAFWAHSFAKKFTAQIECKFT